MADFYLLHENRWPGATLAASTEASALPVEHSQSPDRLAVWRSMNTDDEETIDADLGEAVDLSMVAIANLRLKAGGALVIETRGTSGSPGAATALATISGQDSGTRVASAIFATMSVRHLRLRWTNPDDVVDYAEAGYVGVGTPFAPDQNISVPVRYDVNDPSVRSSSLDGQVSTTQRTIFRTGEFSWAALRAADLAALRDEVYASVGSRAPVFAVVDEDAGWLQLFCRLDPAMAITVLPGSQSFAVSLPWEEAR